MLFNSILTLKPERDYGENDRMIDMFYRVFNMPTTFDFELVEITSDLIARPDLVSKIAYGTEMYSDVICKVNDISNPFELNEGKILIVPEASELYKFYTKDKDNLDNERDRTVPSLKKKNEKRKANEAITGDVRFKIDSENKVIIY